MRWWGKGIGAAFGWLAAGPWGAALGTLLGNSADAAEVSGRRWRDLGVSASPAGWYPSLFAVLGHVARADGRVSVGDVRFANRLMTRLGLGARRRGAAVRAYNLGREPGFRPESSLLRLRATALGDRRMSEGFLAVMVAAATLEGEPPGQVLSLLERCAVLLGVESGRLDAMLSERGVSLPGSGLQGAYAVLGVSVRADDREVKLAYRRLMHRHHPDRLGAQAGEASLERAARRTAEIRRAWETIRAERGIR